MKYLVYDIKSFLKNISMGKFKAVMRYFYDEAYREEIKYMKRVVRSARREVITANVSLNDIFPGHSINYPEWVETLVRKIEKEGVESIEPIKVVFDSSRGHFLVVDGNHRLAALKRAISGYQLIKVRLLTEPIKVFEIENLITDLKYVSFKDTKLKLHKNLVRKEEG